MTDDDRDLAGLREAAEVTREHRLTAWRALRASSYEPHEDSVVGRWIAGLLVSVDTAELFRVAQAIAEAESRGRASVRALSEYTDEQLGTELGNRAMRRRIEADALLKGQDADR